MTFRKLRASSARPHHIRGVVILHKPRLEHKSCQSQLRADSRVSPNACQGYPPDPARTSAEPECLEVKTFVNDTALFYPSNLRSASFSFFFFLRGSCVPLCRQGHHGTTSTVQRTAATCFVPRYADPEMLATVAGCLVVAVMHFRTPLTNRIHWTAVIQVRTPHGPGGQHGDKLYANNNVHIIFVSLMCLVTGTYQLF